MRVPIDAIQVCETDLGRKYFDNVHHKDYIEYVTSFFLRDVQVASRIG